MKVLSGYSILFCMFEVSVYSTGLDDIMIIKGRNYLGTVIG